MFILQFLFYTLLFLNSFLTDQHSLLHKIPCHTLFTGTNSCTCIKKKAIHVQLILSWICDFRYTSSVLLCQKHIGREFLYNHYGGKTKIINVVTTGSARHNKLYMQLQRPDNFDTIIIQ